MAERSYDEFFRESYPRLVAFGTSMSGDRELARDLAQETMLRAHHRWDELQDYEHPAAWSRRVMNNLLIDRFRSGQAERTALDRSGVATVADIDGSVLWPDAEVSVGTTPAGALDRWNALLSPLTARQRAIATLYYADDESVATIASTLGMSAGAVKAALFKIRRRLRRSVVKEANGG